MKQFLVTMELWRETWGGIDQRDGSTSVKVKAANSRAACRKAEKTVLSPGKGRVWSHSRWAKNVTAKEL